MAEWNNIESRSHFLRTGFAKTGTPIRLRWPSRADPECGVETREGRLDREGEKPMVVLETGSKVELPPKDFAAFY